MNGGLFYPDRSHRRKEKSENKAVSFLFNTLKFMLLTGYPVRDPWWAGRISRSNTKESGVIWQKWTLESPVSRDCRSE